MKTESVPTSWPPKLASAKEIVASPHSLKNRAIRAVWNICAALLFRPSPRIAHKYRVLILRLFGGDVDWNAHPYPKCKIWLPSNLKMGAYSALADGVDCYNVAQITLEAWSTVSQYSYLCSASHDVNHPHFPLFSKPIHVGTRAWVAARCYVGPGVTVAEGAVIGANACVYKDVAPWTIVGGNPARLIGKRSRTQL
jgi:putative colanic acid biosynthesis acetyltransferase WcaF